MTDRKRYGPGMRFNMLGIISLMVSAIFIWIYVINSLWTIAKTMIV